MLHKKQKAFPVTTQNALGFTLVELIVVVTILAILATIGFVSYSSYLTGVRDTNRLSQLVSISDGLELYRTKKDLPLPDDNIEIQVNTGTIAYQGYAGSNTLETIDFTKGGKDPKDDSYFTYYLTEDRKYFQLLGFLEEEENLSSQNINTPNISNSYAVDYANRLPTVYGKKLGVLTNNLNVPVQEVETGFLNITSATTGYKAHMTDTEVFTDTELMSINPIASCKRIKQMKGGSSDGVYTINPTGTGELDVYCDMTTDGGGWTFFMFVDNTSRGDYFENATGTYSTEREDTGEAYSITSNIFSHNEMMVMLDRAPDPSPYVAAVKAPDPIVSDEENKIVFYKYATGAPAFNNGPVPCIASPENAFSYKSEIGGKYTEGGTFYCNANYWYTYTKDGSPNFLALFHPTTGAGNYWGTGMGGPNNHWYNNGWWYLR